MSNPTTPFNWQMPTNTDLVTDLPADFEVFGQAVATSMADLLGGTSGQILSKATNADMDFAWITNDVGDITAVTATSPLTGGGTSGAITVGIQASSTTQSGAVQLTDSTSSTSTTTAATPNSVKSAYDLAAAAVPKSTVTTAGDVIYATGSGAVTRLGIGTAGQVLKVNSGATAPEWGAPAGGGMTLLSTTTLTGSSTSISVTPTGYNQILVYVYGVTNGSNGNVFLGLNSNTTAGDYVQSWQGTEGTINYEGANVGIAGVNAIIPGQAGWKGSDANGFAQFLIYAPNSTHRKLIDASSAWFSGSDLNCAQMTVCNFIQTAALSSVQVKTTVGSFTAGTALVYGVK
jgi:hypothetical protein